MANATASSCFYAQTVLGAYGNERLNPDVGGVCVAFANIVISLLLPLLVKWSKKDVSAAVFLLYTQTVPILLATLSSIHGDTLTVLDAHYSTAVVASPILIYVTSSCLLHLFKVPTTLFEKVPEEKAKISLIIAWIGLGLIPLWFSVSIVASFSTTAFINSDYCHGTTFGRYVEFVFLSSMTGVLDVMGKRDMIEDLRHRYGLGLVSVLCLWTWGIYLVRHRVEIIERWGKVNKAMRYLLFGWYIPKASWDVIRENHPTIIVFIVVVLHWGWIASILSPVTFKLERSEMSYGQIISTCAPIPVVISFIGIIKRECSRQKVKEFCRKTPGFVFSGFHFIVTGKRDWDDRPRELDRNYLKWTKRTWIIVILGWLATTSLHSAWIWSYVRAATLPNVRFFLNEPHRNWKPMSVAMYFWGYIVGVINVFICVAAFDFYQESHFATRHGKMEMKPFHKGGVGLTRPEGEKPCSPRGMESLESTRPEDVSIKPRAEGEIVMVPSSSSGGLTRPEDVSSSEAGGIVMEPTRSPRPPSPHSQSPRDVKLLRETDKTGEGGEMRTYIHTLALTLALLVAFVLCTAPFFGPIAALPISQESHWVHDCENFPTEVIMYGQKNSSLSSTISFYSVNSESQLKGPPYPLQKQLVYHFDFFDVSGYKVFQYRPADNATLSQEMEPPIKTTFLDISKRKFYACSLSAAALLNVTDPEAICSDASGTYNESPYLFFSVSTASPPKTIFSRTERKEYVYSDDAPSFILHYATADGNLTEIILLRSALTKRNFPTILKVCSTTMASAESLGPLSIFMSGLNQFAGALDHPRLFSF